MLRRIKLTNFKCFEQLDLHCTPLNLLCGLNGMGKSTVIQALLVLRQSFETGELQNGRLVLGSERIDLGAGSDVLFEDAERDVLGFTLESDIIEDCWELTFDCPRTADLLDALPESAQRTSKDIRARPPTAEFQDRLAEAGLDTEALPLNIREFLASFPSDVGDLRYEFEEWGQESEPPFGGRLVYVNAERVGPRKLYPLSDILARRGDLGASGDYAWSYLNLNQNELLREKDPRCVDEGRRRLIDVVDQWLQDVCPGAHLQLEAVTDADAVIAGFVFDRPSDVASRRYRATNVGFGLSYALPVILALLAPPGTLCLIENPEAHLHPRGQTKLAELAARAAKAGVQVFAETHSDHFMDGVRIAIRDGLIEPEDAAFHYFEREGNKSIVIPLEADSDGRLPHWPSGFFDQHEENLSRLIGPKL